MFVGSSSLPVFVDDHFLSDFPLSSLFYSINIPAYRCGPLSSPILFPPKTRVLLWRILVRFSLFPFLFSVVDDLLWLDTFFNFSFFPEPFWFFPILD